MQAAPEDTILNPISLLLLYINDLPKSIDCRIEKRKLVIIQAQHFLTNNFPFVSSFK